MTEKMSGTVHRITKKYGKTSDRGNSATLRQFSGSGTKDDHGDQTSYSVTTTDIDVLGVSRRGAGSNMRENDILGHYKEASIVLLTTYDGTINVVGDVSREFADEVVFDDQSFTVVATRDIEGSRALVLEEQRIE